MNYNILGLVIEAASGESYVNYIQRHIFEPLEMSHSYTSKAAAQQNGLARGHRHWFSLPFPAPDLPVPLGSLPSGQLISCIEDMAHYLIAHLNGGRYNQVQILSPAGIAELHRGVADVKASAEAAAATLDGIDEPLSRLIAAGVLFQSNRASPHTLQIAVDTASAQGWRRPLLAWLNVQLLCAEKAGASEEASRLRRRIGVVQGGQ